MSFAGVAGVLASIAAIVGGLVWVGKKLSYYFDPTQDQTDQEIQNKNESDKQKAKQTGRPV